jgi:hypothetical protein
MKVVVLALAAHLLLTPSSYAVEDDRRQKCEQTKQKIKTIHSKMRQGYSVRQGIRMDENLRRLKKQRSKYCN